MALTYNKAADMLILLQLKDHELEVVCQVNKYVRSICEDLFKNKLIDMFAKLPKDSRYWPVDDPNWSIIIISNQMKKYLEFLTWKEFYFWFKQNIAKMSPLYLYNAIYTLKEILGELEPIDEAVEVMQKGLDTLKTMNLPIWINRELFIKDMKRLAFSNISDAISWNDAKYAIKEHFNKMLKPLNNIY